MELVDELRYHLDGLSGSLSFRCDTLPDEVI